MTLGLLALENANKHTDPQDSCFISVDSMFIFMIERQNIRDRFSNIHIITVSVFTIKFSKKYDQKSNPKLYAIFFTGKA